LGIRRTVGGAARPLEDVASDVLGRCFLKGRVFVAPRLGIRRTVGGAARPLEDVASDVLGHGSLDRLLVEETAAVRTDLALDVVRNPCTLPNRMNRDRVVLVPWLEGHSMSSG
jgi:hypothetical protein